MGAIERLGSVVSGFREGERVIAGAITPSGHSAACICGCASQDGCDAKHGFKTIGGWKFGNTIDGCQAEYVRVPDAMANLATVPDGLTDEPVLVRAQLGHKVSPLMLCDRLLRLAQDAGQAGFQVEAEHPLHLACGVLDRDPAPPLGDGARLNRSAPA